MYTKKSDFKLPAIGNAHLWKDYGGVGGCKLQGAYYRWQGILPVEENGGYI